MAINSIHRAEGPVKAAGTGSLVRLSNSNKRDLVAALRGRIKDVARGELGEPSQRSRREWRYGSKGSLSVKIGGSKQGHFYDFERGEGGDALALIMHTRGCTFPEALKVGLKYVGGVIPDTPAQPQSKPPDLDAERAKRRQRGRNTWRECIPIAGSLAETYLANRGRDIEGLSLDHCLRWHDGKRMMVARMVDPISGSFTGIHRTFLDEHGNKLERKMLGGRGVICLTPFEEVTQGLSIAEGIEDAMLWLHEGWPIWVATCADAIRRFPVLSGIEALTIFADADEAGLRAAGECVDAWQSAGREARFYTPGGQL